MSGRYFQFLKSKGSNLPYIFPDGDPNAGYYAGNDVGSFYLILNSMIPLALVVGGTLVLLRPGGHLDMDYFSQTLIDQQVTALTIGPGIIRALTNYLEMNQRFETFKFMRSVCAAGDYELFGQRHLLHAQRWTY